MNAKRFLLVSFLFSLLLHFSFYAHNTEAVNEGEFVVVLDAGHGGHDPGNLGNGYLEKNIALNIVLTVGAILEQNENIKVIYTRKDDTFVDLFVRGEIANKANADLFVSVHCDSHSSDAYGAGTFVLGLHANKQNFEIAKKENSVIYLEDNYESRYADYDINSPESVIGLTIMQEEFLDQSIALAKAIQDNFSMKLKRKNREVKQAGFIVLHQTFMPSVLVETGFLTNDAEGAYLNSKQGQSQMGTAIAEAILSYKDGIATASSPVSSPALNTPTPTLTPERETVVEKVVSEQDAAEAFAKDPGASPIVEKTVSERVQNVEEKLPEVTAESREVVETVIEKPLAKKKEIRATADESVAKIETAVEEKEKVVSKEVKPVIETPKANSDTPKETVVASKEVTKPAVTRPAIVFKVQLMASTKNLPLEASGFNGLDMLSKERFKEFYRYLYGNAGSYKEAKILKSKADRNGYPTSYIVAYKDGVRIDTKTAIKMVSE